MNSRTGNLILGLCMGIALGVIGTGVLGVDGPQEVRNTNSVCSYHGQSELFVDMGGSTK